MLTETDYTHLFGEPPEHIEGESLVSPVDGRVVDPGSADDLIEAYALAKEVSGNLQIWLHQIRVRIADLCGGDQKTQRIRGRVHQAKVTFPSSSWDQSILKEAWNAYPEKRDQLLGLSTLRVKQRELKKAIATSGPADFENFVQMISNAERPAAGPPTVTVEKDVD